MSEVTVKVSLLPSVHVALFPHPLNLYPSLVGVVIVFKSSLQLLPVVLQVPFTSPAVPLLAINVTVKVFSS